MSFIGSNLMSPLYCGKGFAKFGMGKFKEAIPLLEKAIKHDPNGERMEIVYSLLGRSYLAIGNNEKAIKNLENAYKCYKSPQIPLQKDGDDFYQNEMKDLLKAYSIALGNIGDNEKAQKITQELSTLN